MRIAERNKIMRKIPKTSQQKKIRMLILGAPVCIFLIGVIADFVIFPRKYGGKVLVMLFAWLLNDTPGTINTFFDLRKLFWGMHPGICVFWGMWMSIFIASLFFLCKQLHRKPEPDAINAVLQKREPYLLLQGVSDNLRQAKRRRNDNGLDALIYKVKCLEEKLFVESDFGYGGDVVIDCENDISRKLQFIKEMVSNIESGNITDNINILNEVVSETNMLLSKRRELKKGN